MSQSVGAAITKYHRRISLWTLEMYFLTVLVAVKAQIEAPAGLVCDEGLFLLDGSILEMEGQKRDQCYVFTQWKR